MFVPESRIAPFESMILAMVRMAMTSMSLIAPFNARIFRRPDEAVDWICRLPGQPPAVRDGRMDLLVLAERLSAELRMARAG